MQIKLLQRWRLQINTILVTGGNRNVISNKEKIGGEINIRLLLLIKTSTHQFVSITTNTPHKAAIKASCDPESVARFF